MLAQIGRAAAMGKAYGRADHPGGRHVKIAIIGAGMAGLTCAESLIEAGHEVHVFDKGRGPGGRMSTRRIEHAGETLHFDHGAQYFTVRDEAFARRVARWEADGIAARWPAAGEDAWVGTPAMNAPIREMAERVGAAFARQVSGLARGEGWTLRFEDGAPETGFDGIVVAVPAEQAAALLEDHAEDFARIAAATRADPCWTLMAAFAARLDAGDACRGAGAVGWAARNSAKPGRDARHEAWVVQAGPDWSRAMLEEERDAVVAKLLPAFAEALGLTDLPEPRHLSAHRWRFAKSGKAGETSLWDEGARIGVCGDWLCGPRVENAFLSGRALAVRIGAA